DATASSPTPRRSAWRTPDSRSKTCRPRILRSTAQMRSRIVTSRTRCARAPATRSLPLPPPVTAMRHTVLAIACLLTLATVAARAGNTKTTELSSHECGLSTSYNVQVDDAGVRLYRHDEAPKDIFIHD